MVNWLYWFLINNTFVLYRLYRWGEDEKQVKKSEKHSPRCALSVQLSSYSHHHYISVMQFSTRRHFAPRHFASKDNRCYVIFCSFSRQWKELDRLFLALRLQVLFHRALLNSFGVQKLQVGRHLFFVVKLMDAIFRLLLGWKKCLSHLWQR